MLLIDLHEIHTVMLDVSDNELLQPNEGCVR